MRKGIARSLSSAAVFGLFALGIVAMITPAEAKRPGPPGPLCGPTILFECTSKKGTELVGLTQCEVEQYERKNRATCVPSAG